MAVTPTPWKESISPPQAGEDVSEAIIGRSIAELVQRTQHLKDMLDTLMASEAILIQDVTLTSAVKVGHAVYYDDTNAAYAPALAAVEFDIANAYYVTSKSAYVVGVVASISGAGTGTIVAAGSLKDFDWTNAVGSATGSPGPYYLSSDTPGELTLQRPPVSVYVLYMKGDGDAHIMPTSKELIEAHIHYKISMVAEPAGVPNCIGPGESHEVTYPDSDSPGWLPADHAIFSSTAPVGAKFGYNIAQHKDLERLFPPIPPDSAYIEVNGKGVPMGLSGRAVVDTNGVWWMEDCYGWGPWAPEASCSSSSSSVSSSSSSSVAACQNPPPEYETGSDMLDEMTMVMWFTKMVFKTDESVVTSLSPATESPITVTDCGGTANTKGDLYLDIDLDFSEQADETGYNVYKDSDGLLLKKGPVVEKIKPGGPDVTITGTIGDDTNGYQGTVTIDLTSADSSRREGIPDLVALDNVREQKYEDVLYLGFQASKDGSIRCKIRLPDNLPTTPKMSLKFWLMAGISGAPLPDMTLSYRRLPAPDGCTAESLPISDTALSALTPGTCGSLTARDYIEVEGDQFAVANRDTVFFTLGRASTDSYAGEVGVLRIEYLVVSGS